MLLLIFVDATSNYGSGDFEKGEFDIDDPDFFLVVSLPLIAETFFWVTFTFLAIFEESGGFVVSTLYFSTSKMMGGLE